VVIRERVFRFLLNKLAKQTQLPAKESFDSSQHWYEYHYVEKENVEEFTEVCATKIGLG